MQISIVKQKATKIRDIIKHKNINIYYDKGVQMLSDMLSDVTGDIVWLTTTSPDSRRVETWNNRDPVWK